MDCGVDLKNRQHGGPFGFAQGKHRGSPGRCMAFHVCGALRPGFAQAGAGEGARPHMSILAGQPRRLSLDGYGMVAMEPFGPTAMSPPSG